MHKPEPVQENKTYKILWESKIQTDHEILARKLNQVIINKKKRTCRQMDFAVSANHEMKMKAKIWTNTWILPVN